MRSDPRVRRIYLASAFGLVLIAATSACSSGGSSSSSTSAPATSASSSASSTATGSSSAVAAITSDWTKFFSSTTSNSERVNLLQNGSEFSTAITAFAKSPLASAVTSKVDSVTLTSSTTANVKYDLTAAGTTVASGQTGTAVLQDGTWKVGDDVFCGLLKEGASLIGIAVPAACSSAT
jgi:purine-cytosine permease-like protein